MWPDKQQLAPGALVISLDFELQWGVPASFVPGSEYCANILGARKAIPRLLDLFEEFEISATWATVGFLFAESREELLHFAPLLRPEYRNRGLDPYCLSLGKCEDEDPMHFAPSLLDEIQSRPRQEIGCHTFSHYYCLEPGATVRSFQADLKSAVALARHHGSYMTSLVFPRNQVTPETLGILPSLGFNAYRGSEAGWMHDAHPHMRGQVHRRLARLVNQYCVPASDLVEWSVLKKGRQVSNVRGSVFLRPFAPQRRYIDELRICRIIRSMELAAVEGKILHLWWHPHNFGRHTDFNLSTLRRILTAFAEFRSRYHFQSLSIAGAAAVARTDKAAKPSAPPRAAAARA